MVSMAASTLLSRSALPSQVRAGGRGEQHSLAGRLLEGPDPGGWANGAVPSAEAPTLPALAVLDADTLPQIFSGEKGPHGGCYL